MAKRPTLTDLTSLTNSSNINAINQNWDAIQTAFDNTLSLDGSTPNAMNSDIDLNGNSLLNVGTIDVDDLTLNGQQVTGLATVPEWRGSWSSGQGYVVNDIVRRDGSTYICLEDHTSGTFSTDLTSDKWELFAQQGAAGAGTGDMVAANNLSDVADPATSRSNLGLGTVAVENIVPVSKGGTGATDAATARTNLSAQTLNANLTSLSGITLVQGDLLYATGPDTLVKLAKGTSSQILRMNSGATAPEWTNPPGWQLVASPTVAGTDAANIITGLGGYRDLWIVGSLITSTLSGTKGIRVGTSGGILSTNIYVPTVGAAGSYARFSDSTNSTRSFSMQILGFNKTDAAKAVILVGDVGSADLSVAILSSTAMDRIQVLDITNANNLTGGTVYVFGRI